MSTGTDSDSDFSELHRRHRGTSRPDQALDPIDSDSSTGPYPVPEQEVPNTDLEAAKTSISKTLQTTRYKYATRSVNDWVEIFFPCWNWMRTYKCREMLTKDLIAGLTVGVMVIPVGMSYAGLAGLPVEYGLYTSITPPILYALLGTSRQLSIGGTAIISLLSFEGLTRVTKSLGFNEGDPEYASMYKTLAFQLSLLVGLINFGMGMLRLGLIGAFLSNAVVSGFMTGGAIIIILTQITYILGYKVPRSELAYELIYNIFRKIDEFNWRTALMGFLSMAVIEWFRRMGNAHPKWQWAGPMGPLVVSIITVILVVAFNLDEHGVPIIDKIPKGLPSYSGDLVFPIMALDTLLPTAIAVFVVAFVESFGLAKRFSQKHRYEVDANQEMRALGLANIVGSMFSSYPSTGSLCRTAVNDSAGAMTQLAGLVYCIIIGLTLLFLTPVFEHLPLNILAAIVISGVAHMVHYKEAMFLWKVHKFDFWVWLLASCGVMFLGIEIGLAIAVGVSLVIVLYESAYPHTAVLARLPGTLVYRNVKQFPEGEMYDGIVIVRINAPLYFANAIHAREKIRKYRRAAENDLQERNRDTVKFVILDLSPVAHIDSTALHMLDDMYETHLSQGKQMLYCNPQMRVMEKFQASGLVEKIGRDHFFVFVQDAVDWCLPQMDTETGSIKESQHGSVGKGDEVEETSRENDGSIAENLSEEP